MNKASHFGMSRRVLLGALAATQADAAINQPLRYALEFGNRFVLWQSPWGGPDPVKCPYRSAGKFDAYFLHGCGPMTRALYRLYQETGVDDYKFAADRYAVFLMNTIHDPLTPYVNKLKIKGDLRHLLSSAWMFGKALSPCYEWFCKMNPAEDAFERKGLAYYRWLQRHRREDSYFGVGYPAGKYEDAQFTCDLGEVGSGLVGLYRIDAHEPALQDAIGLARWFLTDYQDGTARGCWSPKLGVWLVSPWPGTGAEHFTDQIYNQTGWGWSVLVVGEFLLNLRELLSDEAMKRQIADKCVKAMQWCLDYCQFDNGAVGMFSRDDEWVGMAAVPILMYARLKAAKLIPADVEARYRPKLDRTWRWFLANTSPEGYPTDGFRKVRGSTSKKPLENLVWLMAWTVEALLEGPQAFGAEAKG